MDDEKKGVDPDENSHQDSQNVENLPNPDDDDLFRKGKKDKFISPEDLNSLIQIIRPKDWLGLGCLGMIVIFLFIWLFNGQITTDSIGRGLVVQKEGLLYLYSKSPGLIHSINLIQGQKVDKTSVIGYLFDKDYLEAFNQQASKIQQLELSLQKSDPKGGRGSGLDPRAKLDDEKKFLQQMQDNPVLIPIYSEVEGEVIARYVGAGEYIQEGVAIGLVDPPFEKGELIVVYGFFDVANGGKIANGMEVFVSLEKYVNPIHGSLKGRVVYVDPYPGTSLRFLRLIGKDQSFVEFIGGELPKYNIRVEIESDLSDPSGYAWTGGKGPENLRLTPEFCHLRVRVSEDAPIKYLFSE